MKKSFFLIIVLLPYVVKSQFVELGIKNSETGENIPYAHVTYSKTNEGTISNKEGKVKLLIGNDTITIRHISYETAKIVSNAYLAKNDIYLQPRKFLLDEVTIYSIDLKDKLNDVLNNYDKIYIVGSNIYQCTYKETYSIDDTLSRLFQIKMKFWTKDYKIDLKKPIDKHIQVSIDSIDYSKLREGRTVFGGSITNDDFFKSLHLNYCLRMILNYGKDITIESLKKTKATTEIIFSSLAEENGKIIGSLKENIIHFDNITGAILKLNLNYVSNGNYKQKGISGLEKTAFTFNSTGLSRNLSFVKDDGRLRLNHFQIVGKGEVEFENEKVVYKLKHVQDLFVTKVEKGKKIPKLERIDLSSSFHKNIPNMKKSDPKILLTQEELAFINEKQ